MKIPFALKLWYLLTALTMLAAMALAAPPTHAAAVIIAVTTTNDELNADGDCSLREAIRAAALDGAVDACPAGSGADTINVPVGTYTLRLGGANEDVAQAGDFDLTGNVAIVGAGATGTIIDGNQLDRVFDIHSGSHVMLTGVTVRNGLAPSGAGIFNAGALRLQASIISGNTAASIDGGGGGGAIFNQGLMEIVSSTVSGNVARDIVFGGGGGINNDGTMRILSTTIAENWTDDDGGGIFGYGNLLVTDSIISGNTAASAGGGIWSASGSDASIIRTSISNNTASSGGGLYNDFGTVSISASTTSGNTASFSGGGLYTNGPLIITSSTVSSNSASDSFYGGGGIFIAGHGGNAGALTLRNSTVSNNDAPVAGGISNLSGSVTTEGSIVAGNGGGNCTGTPVLSVGHNLSSDTSCNFTATSDLNNADPLLGPLADNGGSTRTQALQPGSPAIDSGSADCPSADQRGVPRPQDGDGNGNAACDIGAFEREGLAESGATGAP